MRGRFGGEVSEKFPVKAADDGDAHSETNLPQRTTNSVAASHFFYRIYHTLGKVVKCYFYLGTTFSKISFDPNTILSSNNRDSCHLLLIF